MDISAPLFFAVLAPFAGSFAGVVGHRADAPRSILLGRSACPACRHVLGPLELVPLISWVAQRGRCRHCSAAIGVAAPTVELAAIGIVLWSASVMSGVWLWASCILGWTLLALAISDLRHQLLPDFLTVPLLIAGLAITAIAAPEALSSSLLGAAAGFTVLVLVREAYRLLRAREGIGLGDAKLLAAAGAWTGWEELASTVTIAAAAAFLSLATRYFRGEDFSLSDRIPFGAYLCLGLWIDWLYGPFGSL